MDLAHQAPLSMGFSRQEYWSQTRVLDWVAMPPRPGALPDSGIEPTSLTSPVLAGRFFTPSATWETPQRHDSWPFQIYSLILYNITNKTQFLFIRNVQFFPHNDLEHILLD